MESVSPNALTWLNFQGSMKSANEAQDEFQLISRGKISSAMTDSSIPATRGSSQSALSEPSVESLSNSLRSAEGEHPGREFFTVSREKIGLGDGASYSLRKGVQDKKYINPRAQSPSDPPDSFERYKTACWNSFQKFSQSVGDTPMVIIITFVCSDSR